MNGLTIHGLSLTRPWPFAFVAGPELGQKRIENRVWTPPKQLIGHFLALHAAKSWAEDDRARIAELMQMDVPGKADSPHSQIFAVCQLVGWIEHDGDERLLPTQRKWFFGPYGWLLTSFVRLHNPVPCAGAQKLWNFNAKLDVLAALRESYRESTVRLKLACTLAHTQPPQGAQGIWRYVQIDAPHPISRTPR
ncbi:MAG TPA: hypothetical protein VF525_07990 [Pyrinomonadaceae bacterium]|jgi:hypothetical protein